MTVRLRVESFSGIPERNYNTGWGLSCTEDMSTLGSCTTEESSVRVVVVMRILLQPFTSFGCHGYTAGGLSSWTPRWEVEEGGKQGSMGLQRGCHASLYFVHQLTGPGSLKKSYRLFWTTLWLLHPLCLFGSFCKKKKSSGNRCKNHFITLHNISRQCWCHKKRKSTEFSLHFSLMRS